LDRRHDGKRYPKNQQATAAGRSHRGSRGQM